jgi:hypothetical protein
MTILSGDPAARTIVIRGQFLSVQPSPPAE